MLDFILSNIYVIAIIGFALISFLSKGNKPGAGQRSSGGMPTFGGGGEERGRGTHEEPNSSRGGQSYDLPPVQQSSSADEREHERVRWELEREREQAMNLIKHTQGQERTSLVDDQDSSAYDLDVPTVTSSPKPISPLAEEAVKGIIWSEILGPPRAKRGFHRRNS